MDSENFFKKIRSIIREEIDYALEKKIPKNSVSKSSQTKEIEHGMKLYKEQYNGKKPAVKKPTASNSKFNSIQDILNETKRTLNESMEMEREFTFTSDMAENFGYSNQSAAIPQGYSSNDIPENVMDALTKDYSALMKAIDEKKGR
jgi:hypothetical protein